MPANTSGQSREPGTGGPLRVSRSLRAQRHSYRIFAPAGSHAPPANTGLA